MSISELTNNLFRDKHGNVAIVQFPNFPLILWVISTISNQLFVGTLKSIAGYVAFVSILVWAGIEIYSGSSLFRKILGVVVVGVVLFNRFG